MKKKKKLMFSQFFFLFLIEIVSKLFKNRLLTTVQRALGNMIHKQKMNNNYVNLHGYCSYGQDIHNFK